MSGWIMPLRRGKKKVQSNHLVVSGTEMVALRKVRQYGQMLTRNRPVMKTIFTVTLFSVLQYGEKSLENLGNVKDLLLILVAGLVWKWCAIIAQMRKISAVGIRKLVTEVQIIQIFCEIHI